jgi:pyruvate/2-oxoglutarate dehydrogenase complex dihydrolipoamide dehydrogenase (E3) component
MPPDSEFAPPPADTHNQRLAANVHPPDWRNPEPASRYNLVVIGAGTAGLVAAAGAAGLGAKVALIERRLMGGDCLNFGCVPSKAILAAARAAKAARGAPALGVRGAPAAIDFAATMARMREARAGLSANDSAHRFRQLGVDVFLGTGKFVAPDAIAVDGAILRFRRAVIATGSRPVAPPIPGLETSGYLTNETVFSLTAMPRRLAIIGGGPIGCELAQAFRRFGAEVAILEAAPRILGRDDAGAAALIERTLSDEGVRILTGCVVESASAIAEAKILSVRHARAVASEQIHADEILVAAGRAPNLDGLALDAAGIASDPAAGVIVDDFLRTTNRRVYAAGDVCTQFRFTHAADAMARIVIRNALFFGRARMSALTIPSCVYTDPEVAHTGLSAQEAEARGAKVKTLFLPMSEVDRAVLDGRADGFAKIHVARRGGRILGGTIVAPHAGEIISELTFAIARRVPLGALANVIHPYPTVAETLRKLADQYNRSRLTPRASRILARWFAWRR